MKKITMRLAVFALLFAVALSGCQGATTKSDDTSKEGLVIVASLFPQYDFTRAIIGDRGTVTLLTPPGVETHSFEPSPKDIIDIENADLFIYTGKYMEVWAEGLLEASTSDKLVAVDVSQGIELDKDEHDHEHGEEAHEHDHDHEHGEEAHEHDHDHEHGEEAHEHDHDHEHGEEAHEHDHDHEHGEEAHEHDHDHEHGEEAHEHDHDHEHHHHEYDPHIWTSPVYAMKMVNTITEAVIEADPDGADIYRANADKLLADIQGIDDAFREVAANGKRKDIYFGSRFALHYLCKEYGLTPHAVFDSCSDETEPSVASMTAMVEEIRANDIPVVYYQELADPKVARAISEETGAEPLLFHSAHNLSKEDFESGLTWVDLMKANVENLEKGLN